MKRSLQLADRRSAWRVGVCLHIGIDWLIAIVVIGGAVMTLAASDRIVLKLMKQQANYNWRNRFK